MSVLFECAICFEEYTKESGLMYDNEICEECSLKKSTFPDKKHPIKRIPVQFCICGKPYGMCTIDAARSYFSGELNPKHRLDKIN